MSLGVFIDAVGGLKKDLEGWKNKINSTKLEHQYTAHPSHLTLINVDVENENEAANYLSNQFKIFDNFRINIKKKDIFWRTDLSIPSKFLLKLSKFNFLDRQFNCPSNVEEFLTFIYGNWKKTIRTSNKKVYMTKNIKK